jgi:tubulin beta
VKELQEFYHDCILNTYSVFPSPVSDVVVAPYNTIFSLHWLVEVASATFCIDNQALYDICRRSLKLANPTYGDLNNIMALFMAGTTASLRFPGQLNADLRKALVSLVPYPRPHFFSCGFAPLASFARGPDRITTVPELTSQLFDRRNMMATCDWNNGKYHTAMAQFRGQISSCEVDEEMWNIEARSSSGFVEWLPSHITTSICSVPPRGLQMAATLTGNSTALRWMLKRIETEFSRMWARRAFEHWYDETSIVCVEFDEARSNVVDLIAEYEMYEVLEAESEGAEEGGGQRRGS